MDIKDASLNKYSNIEQKINDIKKSIIETIKNYTNIIVEPQDIDIKEITATLNISSIRKSIIFEKKLEIESELQRNNVSVSRIQ